jgi:hypothetical protein
MALDDRIGPTNVMLEGKSAVLFRIVLSIIRKKRNEHRKLLPVTVKGLMSTIITAYLLQHEQDIMEDVTDEVEQLAARAVIANGRKYHPGLPYPTSRQRRRRATATAEVPTIPNDGGDAGTHEGGSAAPAATAIGDKAAE